MSTTLGPDRVEHPYRHAHQQYAEAGWEGVLPLPAGRKKTPPSGFTGYTGGFPEPERRAVWARRPRQNIALRLPARVVGLDVDSYKPGTIDRLRRVEAQAGERPATWRTSRRPDLDHPVVQERSGIYLYRLPDGSPEPDATALCEGVELIRFGHRYALVWPSRIDAGGDEPAGVYGWWGPGGDYTEQVPSPGLLPVLPAEWLNTTVSPERRAGSPVPAPEPEGGWQVGQPGSAAPEGRHQRLVAAAVEARRNGQPRTEARRVVETLAAGIKPAALNPGPGGRPSEADAVVEWAYTTVAADPGPAHAHSGDDGGGDDPVYLNPHPGPKDPDKADHDWYHGIHDDRLLAACIAGVGWDLRYNIRAQRAEVQPAGQGWEPTSDRLEAALFQTIRRRCLMRRLVGFEKQDDGTDKPVYGWKKVKWGGPTAGNRREAWDSLCLQRTVDPFLLWLNGLPAWDRRPRLDDLFEQAGFELAEGTDVGLACYAARLPFLAAVRRAIEPGAKYDLITVLIGPQGCGKSGFYEEAVPPDRLADWFGDSLNLGASDQKKLEATSGKVINEAADLAGMRHKEREALKQWVTIRVDYLRRPWRRNSEAEPRRGVIVGTSNESAALPNDPTGNRRFVPVEAVAGSRAAVNRFWAANREQVWAEALHRVKAGERLYLNDRAARAQAEAALKHKTTDSETAGYLNWYLSFCDWNPDEGVSEAEIITAVKQPVEPVEPTQPAGQDYQLVPYRVRNQLTEWGWQRRRVTVDGRRQIRWFPKPSDAAAYHEAGAGQVRGRI